MSVQTRLETTLGQATEPATRAIRAEQAEEWDEEEWEDEEGSEDDDDAWDDDTWEDAEEDEDELDEGFAPADDDEEEW